MTMAFLPVSAANPSLLAIAITTALFPLTNRKILGIGFMALDPYVGRSYRAIISHDVGDAVLNSPYVCQAFSGPTLIDVTSPAAAFVALHAGAFFSPLISTSISSKQFPCEHAGLLFWTTDAANGLTNWWYGAAGGGGGGGGGAQ